MSSLILLGALGIRAHLRERSAGEAENKKREAGIENAQLERHLVTQENLSAVIATQRELMGLMHQMLMAHTAVAKQTGSIGEPLLRAIEATGSIVSSHLAPQLPVYSGRMRSEGVQGASSPLSFQGTLSQYITNIKGTMESISTRPPTNPVEVGAATKKLMEQLRSILTTTDQDRPDK